jgi:hypothetical protein
LSHDQRWKARGFKCGYCSLARDSGGTTHLRNHLAGIPGDVVACSNVSRNVRDVMLNLVASGKRKMGTNEHRLYVEKAIMDETYGVARRANIPADEAGQNRMATRESLRDIGFKGCSSEPFNRASGSSPPNCGSSLIPTMFEGVLADTTTKKVLIISSCTSSFYETGEDLPQLKFY